MDWLIVGLVGVGVSLAAYVVIRFLQYAGRIAYKIEHWDEENRDG